MSHPTSLPTSPEEAVSLARRRWAAVFLIVAAVVGIVGAALWPVGSDGSPTQELSGAAGNPAAWSLASLADALNWALLVPGAIAVFSYLKHRGQVLGTIGVIAVGGGAVAAAFGTGGNAFALSLAQHADRASGASVLNSVGSGPYFVPFLVLIYFGLVGIPILMLGAVRGRLVRWWVPVIAFVGLIINSVFDNDVYGLTAAALYVLPAVAEVLLAVALLRNTRATSPSSSGTGRREPAEKSTAVTV